MINHARTLLLNSNGASHPGYGYPGEEYVPADFEAQVLPIELSRAYNLLFSSAPDRAMLNYRLRQYLATVHSTELGQYLLDLDPRITYLPITDNSLVSQVLYHGQAALTNGNSGWTLEVLGEPTKLVRKSRLLEYWDVVVQNTTTVQVTHLLPGNEVTTNSYSFTNEVTDPIALPGSPLSFRMRRGGSSAVLPSWRVTHLARPLLDISDIYAALASGVDFGVENLLTGSGEPFTTCSKLWALTRGPVAYKLGAVVVALVYKLDDLYNKRFS